MRKRSEYIEIGKGLTIKEDYTLEVLPDGATLTFDTNERLYIPDGAVVNSKIADGAITASKLASSLGKLVKVEYYQGVSATITSYDTPILLNGWTLQEVRVMTRGFTADATNYWTVKVSRISTSGTSTDIGTISCQPSSTNPTWMSTTIGPYTANADYALCVTLTKTGSPADFNGWIKWTVAPV